MGIGRGKNRPFTASKSRSIAQSDTRRMADSVRFIRFRGEKPVFRASPVRNFTPAAKRKS
jgi:hypothetical protein